MTMHSRTDRLLELFDEATINLLLVDALINVRYLTGFTGSNALALIGPDVRTFLTDFRYVEQAAEQVDPSYHRERETLDLIEGVLGALPAGELRLGFDDTSVTVRQHTQLREMLPGRVELVPAGGLVERVRAVKTPDEVQRIRAATELADAALLELLEGGLFGRTERQLADELETAMRIRGASHPSFDSIVAGGPHGALPHASPRDVEIARGDLVVIDWGAVLDGYCSDCTRTVAAGEPSERGREIYELVLSAQMTGLEAVREGAGGRDVDAAARQVIDRAGQAEHFGHGLGHGVGVEVHEAPRLSRRSEDQLQAGNVVTVEPGVYLPGELGVRIEDLVVVTADGPEILTGISKQLTVVS